jgi:hypothetical protein
MNHQAKGNDFLVTPSAVLIPQALHAVFIRNPSPQQQDGFRQRHPCQHLFRWTIHVRSPCLKLPCYPPSNNDAHKMITGKDLRNIKMETAVVGRPAPSAGQDPRKNRDVK